MTKLTDLQTQLADVAARRLVAENRLAHARAHKRAERDQLVGERDTIAAAEAGLLDQIAALGDPKQLVGELDDRIPIVLFPVRVETRFVMSGRQHELLIRVFPDDCQVQTFTDFVTESELRNVRRYWIDDWKAGGVEAQRRAAWRGLVSSHGSGRATHLVGRYKPTGTAPIKARPEDLILVVAPSETLTPAERAAAETFWIATWRAGRNASARDAALSTLIASAGSAADRIRTGWQPGNFADEPQAPHARADVAVTVVVIDLPPPESVTTSTVSWQQAPRALTLPERFVFTGVASNVVVFSETGRPIPRNLHVGPDPLLPEDEQIKRVDGRLQMNKQLRWVVDFEAAIANGMAIRIPLTPAQSATGLDRLTVLGVRLTSNAERGAQELEALLRDHHASKNGLALLPQGTPTNNTDDATSGYSWLDDAEHSFDTVFGGANDFPTTADPLARSDGEWLAQILGIDVEVLRSVAHAGGHDQADARAMNTLLWPATWGYFFDTMLAGAIDGATVERLRRFFITYVSGRGTAPALRIGKQPYGILPAVRRSGLDMDPNRKTPIGPRPAPPPVRGEPFPLTFLTGLKERLDKLFDALQDEIFEVAHVGKPSVDPQQLVLDILGLHPCSVEYFRRFAQSWDQYVLELFIEQNALGHVSLADLIRDQVEKRRREIAELVGLDPDGDTPILDKILDDDATPLTGPVIDDVPLSETAPIRAYTNDSRNYLAWLRTSHYDAIYREDFGGKPKPKALLYLLARHAVMLSYWDASVRLLAAKQLVDPEVERREASFIGVGTGVDGKSRFANLISVQPTITGDSTTTIAQFLDKPAALSAATSHLHDVKAAIARLEQASTGRLERVFAEHIDLCAYRIDAWRLGLVHHRLSQLRAQHRRGVYLGGFAILENVRSENKVLQPFTVPPNLASTFDGDGRSHIVRDASNGGYIHAPSLGQAATAAVLRNAYLSHATPAAPGPMSINLSSARVRAAMALIEGLQNGQGLTELLGYQFERGLHDAHLVDGAEAEPFLFKLRAQFPLTANKHLSTRVKASAKHIQARNVIDGLALIEHVQKTGVKTYPFGLPTGTGVQDLPPPTPQTAKVIAAINAEVDRLQDTNDALADLMLSESVHQVVSGSIERAAAASDVIGKGARPSEPEVIRTPRSGLSLVHRVALHLDPAAPAQGTPRAIGEPALEAWLASRLPAPANVAVAVTWRDPTGTEQTLTITQAELGLGALDVLHLLPLAAQQGASELDDRIEQHVRTHGATHPATTIAIRYADAIPDRISFFELSALIRPLRSLVLRARPLSARDAKPSMAAQTSESPDWDVAELATRVEAATSQLAQHGTAIAQLAADAGPPLEPLLEQAAQHWLAAALHGIPQTGTADPRARVRGLWEQVAAKLRVVIARWEGKQVEYAAVIATLPTLPDDVSRLTALAKAEKIVSTTDTDPRPVEVAVYQPIVAAKRAAFDVHLAILRAALVAPIASVVQWLAELGPTINAIGERDAVWFDLERRTNDLDPETASAVTLRDEIAARLAAVATDITVRVAKTQAAIAEARTNASASEGVKLLQGAARDILGQTMRVLPRFTYAPDHGDELASAHAGRAALLIDLSTSRPFPVDDWLYGIARVREPMQQWEKATLVAEGLGRTAAELVPIQLPVLDGDRWAALELPETYELDGEKLLYTAHYAASFDHRRSQCGLVLDEWTEVVPRDDELTGVAFHFDQPNTEPAQTILVVVPSVFTGKWHWEDIHGAIEETLLEAKARGLDPAFVSGRLGQYLPASMVAVTMHLITIATNLADNLP